MQDAEEKEEDIPALKEPFKVVQRGRRKGPNQQSKKVAPVDEL